LKTKVPGNPGADNPPFMGVGLKLLNEGNYLHYNIFPSASRAISGLQNLIIMKTKFLALASSFVLLFSCNENSIDESINDLDRFKNEISFEAYYNSKLSPLGEIKLDEAKQSTSKQGDTYFVTPIKKSEKLTGAVYSARMSDGSRL
jgi:hypothetical protein